MEKIALGLLALGAFWWTTRSSTPGGAGAPSSLTLAQVSAYLDALVRLGYDEATDAANRAHANLAAHQTSLAGIFDAFTASAIGTFQADQSITPQTGQLDATTTAAIRAAYQRATGSALTDLDGNPVR